MTRGCPECGCTMDASRCKVRWDCTNCDNWEPIEEIDK